MPKVYNKHHGDAPADAVYIGRPGRYGNPFVVGKDGERGECVLKFQALMDCAPAEVIQAIKDELRGKDLVCFCAPARCHGDVLLKIANEE